MSGSNKTYKLRDSIHIPASATSVSFGAADVLSVGSVDASMRLYCLPSTKVAKAVRQLGDEVSSMAWTKSHDSGQGVVWIASGKRAFCLDLSTSKMILTASDAQHVLDFRGDDEDVLNELCVSENKKILVFTTDSGTVGTVDLLTRETSHMKSKHDSICGSARFIPSRPSEVVSGGYDSNLLHFDITHRSILSRHKIVPDPSDSVSLSPSFVLSLCVSPSGLVAAGLADGRVWLGSGGDRSAPSSHKKRARKWEGLRESDSTAVFVAEGPVVAVSFLDSVTLITCTLLGKITKHILSYNNEGTAQLQAEWSSQTQKVAKVNAIATNTKWLVIAGLSTDGKGVAEVWEPAESIVDVSIL